MNRLEINKEIYELNNVQKAINDYSELAKIVLYQKDNYYILDFDNCVYDFNITIKEFENYLIDLSNIKGTD